MTEDELLRLPSNAIERWLTGSYIQMEYGTDTVDGELTSEEKSWSAPLFSQGYTGSNQSYQKDLLDGRIITYTQHWCFWTYHDLRSIPVDDITDVRLEAWVFMSNPEFLDQIGSDPERNSLAHNPNAALAMTLIPFMDVSNEDNWPRIADYNLPVRPLAGRVPFATTPLSTWHKVDIEVDTSQLVGTSASYVGLRWHITPFPLERFTWWYEIFDPGPGGYLEEAAYLDVVISLQTGYAPQLAITYETGETIHVRHVAQRRRGEFRQPITRAWSTR